MTTERNGGPAPGAIARARAGHPLLHAFPLAVMSVATFLVVLALLAARLPSPSAPGIGSSAPATALVAGSGGTPLSTRTSGAASGAAAAAPPVTPATAAEGSPAISTIVTRTSGASGARVGDE